MDAFYASVELLARPDLRGLPVAIGGRGDPNSRAVVTTATYEARAFGIRSGMPLARAAALCPGCVFLPTDFDAYKRMSRRFKDAIATIAPRIEDRGIDEVYIDLDDIPTETVPLARAIKDAVHAATGLTCSIGVAPNKLLAKIASELDKPDGLTVLSRQDVPTRIWPMSVGKINGIGPKAEAKLEGFGIRTVGELAGHDPAWLVERFGRSYGQWLHDAAHGRDDRPVVTFSEPRSRSRETTFERDLHPRHDRAELGRILDDLSARVAADLCARGYVGRTVGVKLRFDDFSVVTRDATLEAPTADARTIRVAAARCIGRVTLRRRLRLMGVRVSNLLRADDPAARPPAVTLDLFD